MDLQAGAARNIVATADEDMFSISELKKIVPDFLSEALEQGKPVKISPRLEQKRELEAEQREAEAKKNKAESDMRFEFAKSSKRHYPNDA